MVLHPILVLHGISFLLYLINPITWVFDLAVISFLKIPLYEGVNSIFEIFKIYVCKFRLEFLKKKKKKEDKPQTVLEGL